VVGSCEHGDEPSVSGAMELVMHSLCSTFYVHVGE
jgi:hypothetical protein